MAQGTLQIQARTPDGMAIPGATVKIADAEGTTLKTLTTDNAGDTGEATLQAPDATHNLSAGAAEPHYGQYTVTVSAPGYDTAVTQNVEVYDGVLGLLPVTLAPGAGGTRVLTLNPPAVESGTPRLQEGGTQSPAMARVLREVKIPDTITVHLGAPDTAAQNVRVPFKDYLKNAGCINRRTAQKRPVLRGFFML